MKCNGCKICIISQTNCWFYCCTTSPCPHIDNNNLHCIETDSQTEQSIQMHQSEMDVLSFRFSSTQYKFQVRY